MPHISAGLPACIRKEGPRRAASPLQEDVLRAEKEVARLRTLYTDKNPRLAVVLKAQAESRAKLDAFLKENEMPAMTSVELERLTAVYEKLKDTEIEYEVQKSGKEALEKEIAARRGRTP